MGTEAFVPAERRHDQPPRTRRTPLKDVTHLRSLALSSDVMPRSSAQAAFASTQQPDEGEEETKRLRFASLLAIGIRTACGQGLVSG